MIRLFTKNATGVAPDGRWYAGDVNALQDAVAAIADFTQTIGLGVVQLGETGLQLLRYGAGEARMTGHMRVDGILRGLSGMLAGAYTTSARDAIPLGQRPFTLVIFNTTTNQYEWNSGTDPAPVWAPLSPPIGAGSIGTTQLAALAVTTAKIALGAIDATLISGTLKPSVSAAAATEALRALGITGSTAAAGNDARLSDTRTPTDNTVSTVKIQNGAVDVNKLAASAVTDAKVAAGAAISLSKLATIPVIGQTNALWRVNGGSVSLPPGSGVFASASFSVAFSSLAGIGCASDGVGFNISSMNSSGVTFGQSFGYSGTTVWWNAVGLA